uniref:Uncharacterized protein n=1 Tax=Arundo donax TaxID=35708 RepID=A0A0A9CGT4_ARUDO
MKHRKLNNFPHLLNLFFATSNIIVRHIRFFIDCHHSDAWINFGWQRNLNLVLVSINTNSHAFLNISWRNFVSQSDHKLCDLFDIYDIFSFISIRADDFCASCNLQWLLFLHHLLV